MTIKEALVEIGNAELPTAADWGAILEGGLWMILGLVCLVVGGVAWDEVKFRWLRRRNRKRRI